MWSDDLKEMFWRTSTNIGRRVMLLTGEAPMRIKRLDRKKDYKALERAYNEPNKKPSPTIHETDIILHYAGMNATSATRTWEDEFECEDSNIKISINHTGYVYDPKKRPRQVLPLWCEYEIVVNHCSN